MNAEAIHTACIDAPRAAAGIAQDECNDNFNQAASDAQPNIATAALGQPAQAEMRVQPAQPAAALELAAAVQQAANPEPATPEDTRTPEEIFRDAREAVVACLNANHANTLALLEVLKHCPTARPYREVEDELYELPAMNLTHQNPHTLSLMLVRAGGLDQIMVEEDADEQSDQPVDYLLCITPAGQAALEDFEPVNRFARLTADEPGSYHALYKKVLCLCDEGAKLTAIEDALDGEPAMRDPKQVYAGYFVSKLETVGAIIWNDKTWNTTASGMKLAAAL